MRKSLSVTVDNLKVDVNGDGKVNAEIAQGTAQKLYMQKDGRLNTDQDAPVLMEDKKEIGLRDLKVQINKPQGEEASRVARINESVAVSAGIPRMSGSIASEVVSAYGDRVMQGEGYRLNPLVVETPLQEPTKIQSVISDGMLEIVVNDLDEAQGIVKAQTIGQQMDVDFIPAEGFEGQARFSVQIYKNGVL